MDSKNKPPKPVPKPGQVKVVRSLYKYDAQQQDELSFDEGELLYIIDMSNPDWFKAKCGDVVGLIPSNYVQESMESMDFPLHDAAKRGNIQFVTECIDNKVSVNGLDKSGSTPLHWACRGGHFDCIKYLLAQDSIKVNVQNKLGDSSLHYAAWKGHHEVVEMLIEKGAELDVKNIEKKIPFELAKDPKTASLLQLEGNQHDDYEDYQSDSD